MLLCILSEGPFPSEHERIPVPLPQLWATFSPLLALSNELVLTLASTYNKGKNKLRVLLSENVRKDGLKK